MQDVDYKDLEAKEKAGTITKWEEHMLARHRDKSKLFTTGTPKGKSVPQRGNKKQKPSQVIEEYNLQVVTNLIRKHGVEVVKGNRQGQKLKKQMRILNLLDVLYDKGWKDKDVNSIKEYLNRTAGAVSQTVDLNEHKKKLIILGEGKTESKAKVHVAKSSSIEST